MKKNLLMILPLMFLSLAANAGERNEIIASYAFGTPVGVSVNRQKLVSYLTRPYKNDYEKLQSIAYWIASHIAYDGYKYNNGKISLKELNYEYDALQYRTGICTDYAKLFADMAKDAGISGVEYVTGYVLENQNRIKRRYTSRDINGIGHAWNRVQLGKRKFFVDTTYMAEGHIGGDKIRAASSFKHKVDLKKRSYKNTVNMTVCDFFFDFTPEQELRQYNTIHLMDKYIN